MAELRPATKLKLVAIWEFVLAGGILAFLVLFFSADKDRAIL